MEEELLPEIKATEPTKESIAILKEKVDEYLQYISGSFIEDNLPDYRNDIFEAAMEMFYGLDVWKFVNKVLK